MFVYLAPVSRKGEIGKAATRRDIKELETTIGRDMKEMEQKLTIRFGVMMAASVAVISALVKIL